MTKASLHILMLMSIVLIDNIFSAFSQQSRSPVQGIKCAKNQVVNKLTVYKDGAIEAECGPMPCGVSGERCIDDQSACRADTDVFSGMKWAQNGQSLLLRCCSYSVPNKIYVGTDLVSLGSYYAEGVSEDISDKKRKEYDFVSNVRTEQFVFFIGGGVRIWVYRIICPLNQQEQEQQQQQTIDARQQQKQFDAAAVEAARQQVISKSQAVEQRRQQLLKQIAENQDAQSESFVSQEERVVNPLQYGPRSQNAAAKRVL